MARLTASLVNGQSISKARIEQGMSMSKLALKSGLSVASISKIERGTTQSVRPLSAQKICDAMGIPFDNLFTIETVARTTA